MTSTNLGDEQNISIGKKLFEFRDYTAVPLILLLLLVARPTPFSATLGTLIAVIGELLRLYSSAFIGGVSRTRSESLGQKLIVEGPYKYVRNPLYVANFIITLGVGVFSGALWFMMLSAILCAVQYYYISFYEESLLIRTFGEEYEQYRQSVPKWWLNRIPSLSQLPWPYSFSDAFFNERWTILSLLSVLLLTAAFR